MTKIFDRKFISTQHGRRSPIPAAYRFLFDHAEADTHARLDFLKEKPQRVAIHGRRFFDTPAFPHEARFKFSDNEQLEFLSFPTPLSFPRKRESLALSEAEGDSRFRGNDRNNESDGNNNFDLILSLFSLHAINDVPNALNQFKTILAERGMLLACVFGSKTLVTLRQALAAAENELYGAVGSRMYPFAEAPAWVGQLQNTGYALPVADSEIVTVHYKSLRGLLTDIRMMGEASGLVTRTRRPLFVKIIQRAEEIYRSLAPDPDGLLPADYEIIWLQGFKS